MQRIVTFLMAGGLLPLFAASLGAGAVPDHLACYKVKDTAAKAGYTATVSGLAVQAGCMIRVPAAMTCVAASKTSVTPPPPGGGGIGRPNGFTCYKVKCPTAALAPVTVQDQFGARALTPTKTSLLCAPDAGPTDGGFPATGQTTCWNDFGAVIPCAGTGQDGDTRTGAALAYVDNGDGTITDANTGLTWEKQSNGDGSIHDVANSYTWDSAFGAHVGTLNSTSFAGHNDWRLPNRKELESILDLEHDAPAVSSAFNNNCPNVLPCPPFECPPCTVLTCSCTDSDVYWSSTTSEPVPASAWMLDFSEGMWVSQYKACQSPTSCGGPGPFFTARVRAVRGGP